MANTRAAIPAAMSELPHELAERLWGSATLINAKAGKTLVSHGTTSTSVYVVLKGRLQVMLFSMSGREIILRDLSEGEMFGELAAIDGQPRSASIVALSDCLLASIDAATFRAAVSELPQAALWLARRLTVQIRDLTDRVFELNALRVSSRLHCELLRRCSATGAEGPRVPIEPSPTHAELASCIGTHREAVTREMGYLVERGIVRQQHRRIIVEDTRALARLVQMVVGDLSPANG
jgi:CRP/FNR family transcriptional regulator, cyclic AMP receptor protein